MKLNDILLGLKFSSNIDSIAIKSIDVDDICYNSKFAKKGKIFVAIKGETVDGHNYINNAYDNGCRVFVITDDVDVSDDAVKIIVDDTRVALSKMSANLFENPSKELKVVGVTGTKGKTTVTNYIKHILLDNGINAGVIGTNGIFYNDVKKDTVNTTPESYELQKTIREMKDNDVEVVLLEVSSGGLMMHRVDDIDFFIGVFTNLYPDHIGPKEHSSFEEYRYWKSRLFKLCKYGFVNVDDDNVKFIVENADCKISTFSITNNSDMKAYNIHFKTSSSSLISNFNYKNLDGEIVDVQIPSPGKFSIYNALAAISVCRHLELKEKDIIKSIKNVKVDGRVEVLDVFDDAIVILDYAHNGFSIENLLNTLLEYKPKRLLCLFGTVGGRSYIRRKQLGDIVAKLCNVAIITTDNPDFENPMDIINDISKSFDNTDCDVIKEIDRAKAINKAVELVRAGDILVVAGKGHEKYQYINGKRVFFDEKQEIIDAAKKRRKI